MGRGDGTFETSETYEVANNALYFSVLEDLNQDGYLDVATTVRGSNSIGVLFSQPGDRGSLTFTPNADQFGTAVITVTEAHGIHYLQSLAACSAGRLKKTIGATDVAILKMVASKGEM